MSLRVQRYIYMQRSATCLRTVYSSAKAFLYSAVMPARYCCKACGSAARDVFFSAYSFCKNLRCAMDFSLSIFCRARCACRLDICSCSCAATSFAVSSTAIGRPASKGSQQNQTNVAHATVPSTARRRTGINVHVCIALLLSN